MNEYYQESQVSEIAQKVLTLLVLNEHSATVLCLEGDLGAGKTTLTQSLAVVLGVTETVVSPTFVIAKHYTLEHSQFSHLVHIDAYRIDSEDELGPLKFAALLEQPRTLVIIEWPKRIVNSIPDDALWLKITHHDDVRHIATR